MSSFEIISDYSKANLKEIPESVLEMTNLKMLFLERNLLVKLPENFFNRLPNLMWLDLRNNQLEGLPKSIAHHEHLEHLLLTNNNISTLPNELGLVINLKALQVADNPLVYPPKKIIQEGTKSIKKYLKEQYETECAKNAEKQKQTFEAQEEFKRQLMEKQRAVEMQEEKLIKVHEKASNNESLNHSNKASEGTKSIKKYLKEQYETECAKNAEKQKQTFEAQEEFKRQLMEKQRAMEMQEEKLIKVHEKASNNESLNHSNKASNETFYSANKFSCVKSRESTISKQTNKSIEYIQNKLSDPNGLSPTLRVKKIEYPTKKPEEPLKIIHKVSKSESKISLKSYFQKSGIKHNLGQIPENILKEGWLNKLRILLNDQERILQQERNLQALSTWRQNKIPPPKVFYDHETCTKRSEPPYGTYPEYSRIPSRGELASQLQTFLREPDVVITRPVQTSQLNLDKVINDLVEQLKEMENNCSTVRSSRGEIEHAGRQIQTIVDIHKKLLQLKSANNYF